MMIEQQQKEALEALLNPTSIAVVGASTDPRKIGALPLKFLKKYCYAGQVYPIHPTAEEIEGWRCYRSVKDVPTSIDLLVIAVAASRIPDILNACSPGKVKSALILSSGYAEMGIEGKKRQEELVALARQQGIRLVGPNSVGSVNLWQGVVPAISQVFDQDGLEGGSVAFVTQSGALGTAIMALAQREALNIGYFISTGNEADLDFSDFCRYFIDDDRVKIIAGYVEGIRDGEKFKQVAKEALQAGKPIILLKVGKSAIGHRAAQSHTGALAGSDAIYQAVFNETGVIRTDSIEELLDVIKLFFYYPNMRSNVGNKVAVLSHSGGAGVLMADSCVEEKLDMPEVSDDLKRQLSERLPGYAALQNPIDMTANVVFNPEVMSQTVEDVLASQEYDAALLCVNLIWRKGQELSEQLGRVREKSDRILAVAWIAGPAEPIQHLSKMGIPVYSDPVRCVRAVAKVLNWHTERGRLLRTKTVAVEAGHQNVRLKETLSSFDAQTKLLEQYQIPLAASILTHNWQEGVAAARKLGYPVAMKVIAPGLLHKSDVGGVLTNIGSEDELIKAYHQLVHIAPKNLEGILIQEMVNGIELFAGIKKDDVFGPVTVFGLGGIYVEILNETVIKPAPYSMEEALDMIKAQRFFPLLDGARGKKKADIISLAQLLSNVSILAVREEVEAVDLNPIIVTPQKTVVVDFKIQFAAE
jgi:acetyltransferase